MASDRQTGLSAGSRVLVGLRFLSVTGQLGSLAKRSLNKLGSCCSSRCLVCVSAGALPQPCTERRWPVAHPATMLWQGPRSMSLPSPRRRARLLEKPQSFNFSPRLALPRHKTPELQKHGTNVSPGPWNHQGKCDGGDPPRSASRSGSHVASNLGLSAPLTSPWTDREDGPPGTCVASV